MVREPHSPLLTLTLKSDHNLLSSAISNDGLYVAASDIKQLRLFKLTYDEVCVRVRVCVCVCV